LGGAFGPRSRSQAGGDVALHCRRCWSERNAGLAFSAVSIDGDSGPHNCAEYVLIDSIEPRLDVATRLIMDVAQGSAPQHP